MSSLFLKIRIDSSAAKWPDGQFAHGAYAGFARLALSLRLGAAKRKSPEASLVCCAQLEPTGYTGRAIRCFRTLAGDARDGPAADAVGELRHFDKTRLVFDPLRSRLV
jgi:hypothetical protein